MFRKKIGKLLNNLFLCFLFLHALLYLLYVSFQLIYLFEIEFSIQNEFIQEFVVFIILGIGGSVLKDYLLLMTICFVFFIIILIKNKKDQKNSLKQNSF